MRHSAGVVPVAESPTQREAEEFEKLLRLASFTGRDASPPVLALPSRQYVAWLTCRAEALAGTVIGLPGAADIAWAPKCDTDWKSG